MNYSRPAEGRPRPKVTILPSGYMLQKIWGVFHPKWAEINISLLQLYYSKKFGGFHPKWEEVNILLLQQLIYCKKFGGFHPKWEEVNISLLQL